MKSKCVLLVEDDEDVRTTIKEILELEEYRVLECRNGKEALNTLLSLSKEELPDCILLDIMMPEMNGIEFCNVLQKKHRALEKSLNIVILTAAGGLGDDSDKCKAIQKYEAVKKPVDIGVLLDIVAKHAP